MSDKKTNACWTIIFLSVITTTVLMGISFSYIVEIQGNVKDVVGRINSALDEYNALLPKATQALNEIDILKNYVNNTIQEIIRNNINTFNNLNALNALNSISNSNPVTPSLSGVSTNIPTPKFP
jgi:predicted PurR-regulated permease PerM